MYYCAYGVIYNVTRCIGTEDLKITYEKVFKGSSLMPGLEDVIQDCDFFLCHIKIETFKEFPFDKLEILSKRFDQDPFMSLVLKNLVRDSLTTTRKDNKAIVHDVCKIIGITDVGKVYKKQNVNKMI